jgi:DNA-binding CsgD family transcriptional regulator
VSDVLARHTALMERVLREYGALIRSSVITVAGASPCLDSLLSEAHFSVFSTLWKFGAGWNPPRSLISTIVHNTVNDVLWNYKWKDGGNIEGFQKLLTAAAAQRSESLSRIHTLSQAEVKVLRLVGLGLSNEEIAKILFISPLTTRTHIKRLHAKLEIKGRAKLALFSYQTCHYDNTGDPNEKE